jgi:hypothetical protein
MAKASDEQLGSTVRVKVIIGGLPATTHTGAMLHRDELVDYQAYFDLNRCVLVLLNDWTEAQLRAPQARFLVFRNLPDSVGEQRTMSFSGRLLNYDAQTKIGAISFKQDFSAETDVGFRLERSAPADAAGIALRAIGPASLAAIPGAPRRPPGSAAPAAGERLQFSIAPCKISAGVAGPLKFPEDAQDGDGPTSLLFVNSAKKFAGFLHGAEGKPATLIRANPAKIEIEQVRLKPISVAFDGNPGTTAMHIRVVYDGKATTPGVQLLNVPLTDGEKPNLSEFSEPYAAIKDPRPNFLPTSADDRSRIRASLKSPLQEGQTFNYLLQLRWSPFPDDHKTLHCSAPFIVRLSLSGKSIVASTEGIENLNLSSSKKETTSKGQAFEVESPIREMYEIAGGREVLLELEGPPFWKRFSLERKEWLPLPSGSQSQSSNLTGNLSDLFVLTRGSGTVKRFRLSDLAELAATRLDLNHGPYSVIRAGCNTALAPIHILGAKGATSIAPDSLAVRDVPFLPKQTGREIPLDKPVRSTGDGITLLVDERRSPGYYSYAADYWGFDRNYFGTDGPDRHPHTGVSAAYALTNRNFISCANVIGEWRELMKLPESRQGILSTLIPNAPVIVQLWNSDNRSIPPQPMRIHLYSGSDPEPFGETEVPELNDITGFLGERSEHRLRVCYDSYSGNLGAVARDSKRLFVWSTALEAKAGRRPLLNWPDSTVVREKEFRFTPHFLGTGTFKAELIGTKNATPVTQDGTTLSFKLAQDELATLLLLKLEIEAAGGGTTAISIPLHVQGAPIAFVSLDEKPGAIDDFAADFKSLSLTKDQQLPLRSTYFTAPAIVKLTHGPINDHLAMVTDAGRVDFFSLKAMKVVGSMLTSGKQAYYAGCGALMEYDSDKRAFTRIKVPEGTRERSITFPKHIFLHGVGFGNEPRDPITLILERRSGGEVEQFGPYTVQTWDSNRTILVLNSETFQAAGWMQPKVWAEKENANAMGSAVIHFTTGDIPRRIPGSRNGQLLTLHSHLLLLSPGFSMAVPFPGLQGLVEVFDGQASGSITGATVTSSGGLAYQVGIVGENRDYRNIPSPCGRYFLFPRNVHQSHGSGIEVRTIEGKRFLYSINRLAAWDMRFRDSTTPFEAKLLGDAGPLMIKAQGGRHFQFLDLDIPRVAGLIKPDQFHVTSQPMPCVIEGGVFEYQLQLNRPDLLTGCKLREAIPNASISPEGRLRYQSPKDIAAPMRVAFPIEISGKDDKALLHDFSIIVVPKKNPSDEKPSGIPPMRRL